MYGRFLPKAPLNSPSWASPLNIAMVESTRDKRKATESHLLWSDDDDSARALLGRPPQRLIGKVKNISVLCVGFFLVFSSYGALQNLSGVVVPVHADNTNWGLISIGSLYICMMVGSLIAPSIISKTGEKVGMILGCCTYALFMASYFYPKPWVLTPAACLCGIGGSVLWAGQGAYLTRIAQYEATQSSKGLESVVALFNSAFWGSYTTTQIVGNGIGFIVLNTSADAINLNESTLEMLLFGVYTGSAVLGTFSFFFLSSDRNMERKMSEAGLLVNDDDSNSEDEQQKQSIWQAFLTNMKLIVDWRVSPLAPLLLYSGVQACFAWSLLTTHMIEQSKDVSRFMIVYGIFDLLSSVTFGKLGTTLLRSLIFLSLCFILQGVVSSYLIALDYPSIHDNFTNGYTCLNGCWLWYTALAAFGIGDGIVNTQISNTISSLYGENLSVNVYAQWKLFQSMSVAVMNFANGLVIDKNEVILGNHFVLIILMFCSFAGYIHLYLNETRIKSITT